MSVDMGGSVFPRDANDGPSMTMREWFAGMALQGLLSNPRVVTDMDQVLALRKSIDEPRLSDKRIPYSIQGYAVRNVVDAAYVLADCMVAHRNLKSDCWPDDVKEKDVLGVYIRNKMHKDKAQQGDVLCSAAIAAVQKPG